MAVNTNLTMEYYLQQDKSSNPRKSGKWYGKIRKRHGLNLDGLCKHIASHGSLYTEDVVTGVMKKAKSCIIELVSTGAPVKIDGLGTFYPTIESAMGLTENQLACKAALPNHDTPGFTASELVKGVHLRFQPDDTKLDKKTSRAFKEQCQLSVDYVINLTNEDGRALVDYDSWKKGKNEPEP